MRNSSYTSVCSELLSIDGRADAVLTNKDVAQPMQRMNLQFKVNKRGLDTQGHEKATRSPQLQVSDFDIIDSGDSSMLKQTAYQRAAD